MQRGVRHPQLEALARRAAAHQLACPYCQDALEGCWRDLDELQLRCPTCGFTELPDAPLVAQPDCPTAPPSAGC